MGKGFMYKLIRVFIVLAVAVIAAVLLFVLRPEAEHRENKETGLLVETLSATAVNADMIIEAYGTVEPRETLKLIAEVKGKIVDVHPKFKEGNFINKKSILIKIDPRTYKLEVDRRKVQIDQIDVLLDKLQQQVKNLMADLKIAKSDKTLALTDYQRSKELKKNHVIAQTTLDKAEQRYLTSLKYTQELENRLALTGPEEKDLKARRKMAEVLLRQSRLDFEKSLIISPFDGWVLEKSVEIGQYVNGGQYLGRIYKAGAFDIRVRIPIKDLKWLSPVTGSDPKPEAGIFFSDENNPVTFHGHVARIFAGMDEKTRTLPVIVETDIIPMSKSKDALSLRSGMFVKVRIKGKKIKNIFVLPRHAVHDKDMIYIVKDNHLITRRVDVLRSFKRSVFIGKGLTVGERVVTTPLSEVVDGMPVRLKK